MATRSSPGAISLSNSSILAPITASELINPVMFPPGRERPATNPGPTGSATITNTTGIVRVSRCSAAVPGVPCARITSGCKATNSFAKVRVRFTSPPPQRTSIRRLRPSVQPLSARPCVNRESSAFPSGSFSSTLISTPISRMRSGCCACAASGRVTTTPPRRLMNSRRCMSAPKLGSQHCIGSGEYFDRG